MIPFDDLISDSLVGLGQTLIAPELLDLTSYVVFEGIFRDILAKYQRYRPEVKTLDIQIPLEGWTIPDYMQRVVRLRRRDVNVAALGYNVYYSNTAPLEFEIRQGVVYSVPGYYNVEYLAKLTISNKYPLYQAYEAAPVETDITFQLPTRPRLGTVSLTVAGVTVNSDSAGALSGGFLSGPSTVDADGNVTLKVVAPLQGPIMCSFWTVTPGVVELNQTDRLFYDFFAANFLPSYANLRANIPTDNLPFTITNEDLIAQADVRSREFEEAIPSTMKWWIF